MFVTLTLAIGDIAQRKHWSDARPVFVGRKGATGRMLNEIEMDPGGTRHTIRDPMGSGPPFLPRT